MVSGKKSKAERAAEAAKLRAEAELDERTLDEGVAGVKENERERRLYDYRVVHKSLRDFFAYMGDPTTQNIPNEQNPEPGLNNIFPSSISTFDDLLQPGAPRMSFGCWTAWIQYRVSRSRGLIHERIMFATVQRDIERALSLFKATGPPYPEGTLGSLVNWVKDNQDELQLGHEHREKGYLAIEDIKVLARSFLSPTLGIRQVRTRYQLLAWVSLQLNSLLRVGALLPDGSSRPGENKRGLCWSDLTIIIHRARDNPSSLNDIAIRLRNPNSKTEESRDLSLLLTRSTELWCDEVILIFVVAEYAHAMPEGWTLDRMLDPQAFADIQDDSIILPFRAAAAGEPVFKSQSQSETPQSWFTGAINWYFGVASKDASFDYSVTSHTIRRSAAIYLKLQGKSASEICRALRQKWASLTYVKYTGRVIESDASSAVYGPNDTAEDLIGTAMKLHPDRVRVSSVRYVALPENVRQEILADSDFLKLSEEATEYRQEMLDKYQETKANRLPEDVRRVLKNLYHSASREYKRQAAYHEALVVFEDRKHGSVKDTPSSSASPPTTVRLDEYPSFEEVDGDTLVSDLFLSSSSLSSSDAALLNARDFGSNTAHHSSLSSDPLLDPVALSPSVTAHCGRTTTAFPSPGLAPNPPPIDTSEAPRKERGKVSLLKNDSLDSIKEILFGAHAVENLPQIFQKLVSIPNDDALLFAFRPGHAPVGGVCQSCHQSLASLGLISPEWQPSSKQSMITSRQMRINIYAHTARCSAAAAQAAATPEILTKYPGKMEIDPLSGRTGPYSVIGRHGYLARALGKANSNEPHATCATCPDSPTICNMEMAAEHYIFHGFITSYRARSAAEKAARKTFAWDASIAPIPTPVWYHHDGQYHTDPAELAVFAKNFVEERVGLPVSLYGRRRDLQLPSKELIPQDEPPSDEKYKVIPGRFGLCVREGLCLLCAGDPTRPWSVRGRPFEDADSLWEHTKSCLRIHLESLLACFEAIGKGNDPVLRRSYLWAESAVACPDPSCRAQQTTFVDLLEFVNHLVLVHHFHFKGRVKLQRQARLVDISFADEAELLSFAAGSCKRYVRKHKSVPASDGEEEGGLGEASQSAIADPSDSTNSSDEDRTKKKLKKKMTENKIPERTKKHSIVTQTKK